MEQLVLKQAAEYNELVGDVFSKVEFSSLRNSHHLLWISKGVLSLKKTIDNLSKIDSLTLKEKSFLSEINKVLGNHLKNCTIRIEKNKAKEILELSIEAAIERDSITMNIILDEPDYKNFKEAIFILESSYGVLELVKNKLKKMDVEKEDFLNMQNVCKSLFKTYLFLAKEINKEFLLSSMTDIGVAWRHYHPLSELLA